MCAMYHNINHWWWELGGRISEIKVGEGADFRNQKSDFNHGGGGGEEKGGRDD